MPYIKYVTAIKPGPAHCVRRSARLLAGPQATCQLDSLCGVIPQHFMYRVAEASPSATRNYVSMRIVAFRDETSCVSKGPGGWGRSLHSCDSFARSDNHPGTTYPVSQDSSCRATRQFQVVEILDETATGRGPSVLPTGGLIRIPPNYVSCEYVLPLARQLNYVSFGQPSSCQRDGLHLLAKGLPASRCSPAAFLASENYVSRFPG